MKHKAIVSSLKSLFDEEYGYYPVEWKEIETTKINTSNNISRIKRQIFSYLSDNDLINCAISDIEIKLMGQTLRVIKDDKPIYDFLLINI